MKITDEMLQEAAAKVSMAMLDTLPKPEDCEHNFSPQFHRKMRKLLYTNKKRTVLRYAVAVILVVLLGTFSWLGVDGEAHAAFFSWIRTQYENTFVYHFFNPDANTDLPSYTLGWLPEGYVEVSRTQTGPTTLCSFSEPDDTVILFSYYPMDDRTISAVTANGISPESVVINGMSGDFYLSSDPFETNELTWFDQDTGIAFNLSSYLDKITMIKVAQNVLLCNFTK